MLNYSMAQRAELYNSAFPKFPPLVATRRWLYGMWVLGNDYRGSGYYGAYPPAYLKRMAALFPDADNILHLFSGSLPPGHYTRFDCRAELEPEVVGTAERLPEYFKPGAFDLVYADPPYSEEDAEHYGRALVSRNLVMRSLLPVVCRGGYVVWLDQVLPMYRKTDWCLDGTIGLVRSTNHRVRVVFLFRRLGG